MKLNKFPAIDFTSMAGVFYNDFIDMSNIVQTIILFLMSVGLVVSGILLWKRRLETGDYSRYIQAIFSWVSAIFDFHFPYLGRKYGGFWCFIGAGTYLCSFTDTDGLFLLSAGDDPPHESNESLCPSVCTTFGSVHYRNVCRYSVYYYPDVFRSLAAHC